MSSVGGNAVHFSIWDFGLCLSCPLPFLGRVLFLGALSGKFFRGELFVLVVCGCMVSFGVAFASVWFHWNGFSPENCPIKFFFCQVLLFIFFLGFVVAAVRVCLVFLFSHSSPCLSLSSSSLSLPL